MSKGFGMCITSNPTAHSTMPKSNTQSCACTACYLQAEVDIGTLTVVIMGASGSAAALLAPDVHMLSMRLPCWALAPHKPLRIAKRQLDQQRRMQRRISRRQCGVCTAIQTHVAQYLLGGSTLPKP